MTEVQMPSLNERISRVSLAVAEHLEVEKAGHAAEEANQVLRRIKVLAEELTSQQKIISDLDSFSVRPRPVRPALVTSIGKAKTTLRRTSTQLKDADREVRDLLTTPSMNKAIVDAEKLLDERKSAIVSAFETFRTEVRPVDLSAVPAEGLEPASLSMKVRRLQQTFNASRPPSVADLVNAVEVIQNAVSEWEKLKPEVDAAQQRVPRQLQEFVESLNGPKGYVDWTGITEEVRSWLDSDSNGKDYVVVRRDRFG